MHELDVAFLWEYHCVIAEMLYFYLACPICAAAPLSSAVNLHAGAGYRLRAGIW